MSTNLPAIIPPQVPAVQPEVQPAEKPKKKITDLHRIYRLNQIMSPLAHKRTALIAEAVRLGYPYFTDSKHCPTSQVEITSNGRIRYSWNREFYDNCSDLAVQYILLHESLHVVLRHITRRGRRLPVLWNKAADCVINQILDQFYFKNGDIIGDISIHDIENDPVIRKRCKLENHHIYDNNPTVEKVYKLLKVEREELKQQLKEAIQKGLAKEGDSNEPDENMLDDHGTWEQMQHEPDPDVQEAIDEIINEMKEDIQEEEEKQKKGRRRGGKSAGRGTWMNRAEMGEAQPDNSVPWQQLLRNRLASIYKPNDAENWARCHRKIYDNYPDILLPGPHEGNQYKSVVFVSIDTSGSMSDDAIKELVGIVKTLPEESYEVFITWFDTELYIADDFTKPRGRGGTEFDSIEAVVQGKKEIWDGDVKYDYNQNRYLGKMSDKKVGRYPDIVIVLTDGHDCMPTLEHPSRWVWIVTKDGTEDYVKDLGSTIWRLSE